jgi:hypothetical protein
MNDETRKVLEMVSQGKVTVQEAEQLLKAVETGAAAGEKKADPKYFRILVTKPAQDGKKAENVNIRVPISVVRGGLRLSALFPGIMGKKKIPLGNGSELDLSSVLRGPRSHDQRHRWQASTLTTRQAGRIRCGDWLPTTEQNEKIPCGRSLVRAFTI